MHLALAWLTAHPAQVAALAYALLCVLIGVTPARYRDAPWYGLAVRLAGTLAATTHPDSPGTFKLPGASMPGLAPTPAPPPAVAP